MVWMWQYFLQLGVVLHQPRMKQRITDVGMPPREMSLQPIAHGHAGSHFASFVPIFGARQTIPPWPISIQLWLLAVRSPVVQPRAVRDLTLQSKILSLKVVYENRS